MQEELFPLKKYLNQPIEVVLRDSNYCIWLLSQAFFRSEEYKHFRLIIADYYGEPDNTPEHNALQKRFLDERYCLALGKLCGWKPMRKNDCLRSFGKVIKLVNDLPEKNTDDFYAKRDKIDELKEMKDYMERAFIEKDGKLFADDVPFFETKSLFEENTWDVIIKSDDTFCRDECAAWKDCIIRSWQIAVEVKPLVGDDYTKILLKMKAASFHPQYQCLVYENFYSTVTSLEELKKMFESSGYLVFSFSEIENACSG
jgi:hypothetical protein